MTSAELKSCPDCGTHYTPPITNHKTYGKCEPKTECPTCGWFVKDLAAHNAATKYH